MKKFALFVFNGDPMCFIHVLLNALDMKAKGSEAKIIIEGASVKLIPELVKSGNPLNGLWKKNFEAGLIEGVCKACSTAIFALRHMRCIVADKPTGKIKSCMISNSYYFARGVRFILSDA